MTDPTTKLVYFNGQVVGEISVTGDYEKDMESAHQLLEMNGLIKENNLFHSMLFQAFSFGRTAKHIYERHFSQPLASPTGLAPFLVNGSFAIEIYIKALSEKHGIKLHGHELDRLYNKLSIKTQENLEELTSSYVKAKKLDGALDFKTSIISIGNAFVGWRYYYEEGTAPTVNPLHIFLCLDVLHAACVRRAEA